MSEVPDSPASVEKAVHGRRWGQFSLRTLFGGVTAIALGLGLWKYFSPESFEQCAQYMCDVRERIVALLSGAADPTAIVPKELAPPPDPSQAIGLSGSASTFPGAPMVDPTTLGGGMSDPYQNPLSPNIIEMPQIGYEPFDDVPASPQR